MKISVDEAGVGEDARWTNLDDVTHQDLADLWGSGAVVAARHGEKSKANRSGFGAATAVMARIDLHRLPLATAMEAAFTQQFASVAAVGQAGSANQLLIAFELPTPVTDAKQFVRLMAGVETLYPGSHRHSSALEPYGLRAPGDAVVIGRGLTDAAVKWLDLIGLETKERRRGDGAFIRSRETVDRSTVVLLRDGDEAVLEQLPPNTPIYCPVHIDHLPRAVVHWYGDGTPGIQCDHCRRTYAAPKTRREYDFEHFDRVVADLAASQAPIVDRGVESDRDDVITYAEQYLPPQALIDAVTRPRTPAPPLRPRSPVVVAGRSSAGATKLRPAPLVDRATQFELVPGVTLVKSPKGTNKTGILEPFVAECMREQLGVLMIGHRRSLLQSIAARLNIDCYFVVDDDQGDGQRAVGTEVDLSASPGDRGDESTRGGGDGDSVAARYRFVEPKRRYAICLDSLVELDPSDPERQYQVVIIDEAEQVFTHLVGDTVKDRRREVFAKLSYDLRAARHVVLLDADLNMITMEAAFEIFRPDTPVRFIVNRPTLQRGVTMMYGSRGQLAQVLADRARQGMKIYVATNSKNRAYELEKLIRDNAPQSRVAVVTSDNTQTKDVQSLLASIVERLEHQIHVLIASPAIGTGIDITFMDDDGNPRTVVDCVFGFFEGNIVTHFDIDQQLMRVRHPGEVHVWVDARPMNYETDIGCIKRELEKSLKTTTYLLRYEDDGRPVFADDGGLVNIWARVLAASRGSKNRLAPLFTTLREQDGWCPTGIAGDAEASKAGKDAMSAAKEARLQEREQRILSAEPISIEEAKELQARDSRGRALSEVERWALERHWIEQFYGEDISADLIELDDGGRTRQAVMRLECLTSNQAWFANKDAEEIERGVLPFDRRRYLAQREILEAAFGAAGIFDVQAREFQTDVLFAGDDLAQFLTVVEGKAAQIEAIFGITLYADRRQNPVGQLKGLLALVGLDAVVAETTQKGGKKTRRYAIPADRLDDLTGAVARRDSRYKRDEATPCERGGREDRVALGKAKELRAHIAKIQAGKTAKTT